MRVTGKACRKMKSSFAITKLVGCLMLVSASVQVPVLAQDKPGPDEYLSRLMIANPDGSNIRTVMHFPDFLAHGSPDWSENGKVIAIDGWRFGQGEKGSDAQIVVMDADGSNIRLLGDGAMPSLSPQGNRVVYSRYSPNYGIWVRDVNDLDSEPIQLDERGWGTDWSPDGTRIAFTTSSSTGANFCIYNLVEGTREFLFDEGQSPYRQIRWNFAWSPDSKSIAFRGERKDGVPELAVVDARGAGYGLTKCYEGAVDNYVSWTPEGRLMLAKTIKNRQQQIFTMDPAHPTEPLVPFALAPEYSVNDGFFSTDGSQILFIMHYPLPDFAKK